MTTIWCDASHYRLKGGITESVGVAVVVDHDRNMLARESYENLDVNTIERRAVAMALKVAEQMDGPIEVHSDSQNAVKAFGPRAAHIGVELYWYSRRHNKANIVARRELRAIVEPMLKLGYQVIGNDENTSKRARRRQRRQANKRKRKMGMSDPERHRRVKDRFEPWRWPWE